MPVIVRIPVTSGLATESVNVWHFRLPDTARVTEANAAIAGLDTFYEAIKSFLVNTVFTIGSRVTTVDLNPNQVVGTSALTCTGTGSGADPLCVALVNSMSGANIGPRYRGRVYLGPLAGGVINTDGYTVNTSMRTAVANAMTTLIADHSQGQELVVWSRKFSTATTVTTHSQRTVAGVQRRRLT